VGVDDTVWCVNKAQEIYYRSGPNGSWTKAPGALICVSCYDARSVVGTNAQHEIFAWNGSSWNKAPTIGALKHISTAASGNAIVWGANIRGEVWKHG